MLITRRCCRTTFPLHSKVAAERGVSFQGDILSIIENAIDSIQIGIEDYKSTDDRRSISAVRNILAGILLLYKEKLCQLSPEGNKELLKKQNIRPIQNDEGEMIFEGERLLRPASA
jgi:hypothetical protein